MSYTIEGARGSITVTPAARHGVVLPRLARDVQQRVADALTAMCRLELDGSDVSVEAVE